MTPLDKKNGPRLTDVDPGDENNPPLVVPPAVPTSKVSKHSQVKDFPPELRSSSAVLSSVSDLRDTGQPTAPELIPQAHGGALYSGGTPGNRGGKGRLRSEIQEELRGPLTQTMLKVIQEVADAPRTRWVKCECGNEIEVKPPAADADRLRAADIVLKYGTGTPQEEQQGPTVILSLEPPPEYR